MRDDNPTQDIEPIAYDYRSGTGDMPLFTNVTAKFTRLGGGREGYVPL